MKVLLDIKDNKAAFVMELLSSLSYVKVKPSSPYKAQVLNELQDAVESMKLVKEGKLVPRPARDLLNKL